MFSSSAMVGTAFRCTAFRCTAFRCTAVRPVLARALTRRCAVGGRVGHPVRPVIGRFGCAQRRNVASVCGVAMAEGTDIGIAQQRQMVVGMDYPPRTHPGSTVETENLPRTPQRLE